MRQEHQPDRPRYGRSYLTGIWWAELHQRYGQHPQAPHTCAVCGAPHYQLHHRTYERLGHEHISDLMALCDQHHGALHRAYKHHHELHPEDTLMGFTDAWVLIHRRPFDRAGAVLPSLALYGPRHQGRTDRRAAGVAGGHSGAAAPVEGLT
jgi:hypothetical protein